MAANAKSWKIKPFTEGVKIPYSRAFSEEEYARVREGFVPEEMQDKWFIYFEKPFLYFHRSWTGNPIFKLVLTEKLRGAEVSEAFWDPTDCKIKDSGYWVDQLDSVIRIFLLGGR